MIYSPFTALSSIWVAPVFSEVSETRGSQTYFVILILSDSAKSVLFSHTAFVKNSRASYLVFQ